MTRACVRAPRIYGKFGSRLSLSSALLGPLSAAQESRVILKVAAQTIAALGIKERRDRGPIARGALT